MSFPLRGKVCKIHGLFLGPSCYPHVKCHLVGLCQPSKQKLYLVATPDVPTRTVRQEHILNDVGLKGNISLASAGILLIDFLLIIG